MFYFRPMSSVLLYFLALSLFVPSAHGKRFALEGNRTEPQSSVENDDTAESDEEDDDQSFRVLGLPPRPTLLQSVDLDGSVSKLDEDMREEPVPKEDAYELMKHDREAPPCVGSSFSSYANCDPVITKMNGVFQRTRRYCYFTGSAKDPGVKATAGAQGHCYVPRTYPCLHHWHCRPGTFCLHGLPEKKFCDYYPEPAKPSSVAAMMRYHAAVVRQDIGKSITSVRDVRSNIMSPFFENPSAALALFDDIVRSFSTRAKKVKHDTSKSNAMFVHSGDKLFIAKQIPRAIELEDMVDFLLPWLPEHAGVHKADCSSYTDEMADTNLSNAQVSELSRIGSPCWARQMFDSTLLNVPVMIFKRAYEAWVVLVSADHGRCYALLGRRPSRAEPCPWGKAKIFDVKPLLALSAQREGLLQLLGSYGFQPGSPFAKPDQHNRWLNNFQQYLKDVRLLGEQQAAAQVMPGADETVGDDSARLTPASAKPSSSLQGEYPFVDYSLLIEIYEHLKQGPATLEYVNAVGARGCVASTGCYEGEDDPFCHVVCINIIDYFLKYSGIQMVVQSSALGFKWDDYGLKAARLYQCLGHLSQYGPFEEFDAPRIKTEEVEETRMSAIQGKRWTVWTQESNLTTPRTPVYSFAISKKGGVMVFTYAFDMAKDSIPCMDYARLACRHIRSPEVAEDEVHGDRFQRRCFYDISPEQGSTCKAYLAYWCRHHPWRNLQGAFAGVGAAAGRLY